MRIVAFAGVIVAIFLTSSLFAQSNSKSIIPSTGKLDELILRDDVEFYGNTKTQAVPESSIRQRYFLCLNSLCLIVTTEAIKESYPTTYGVLIASRAPATGVYQFQEVDLDSLKSIGIDVESLSKVVSPMSQGMGRATELFLQVSVRPEKFDEFEKALLTLPLKKSSELKSSNRIWLRRKSKTTKP
jgi:hypothetical protein